MNFTCVTLCCALSAKKTIEGKNARIHTINNIYWEVNHIKHLWHILYDIYFVKNLFYFFYSKLMEITSKCNMITKQSKVDGTQKKYNRLTYTRGNGSSISNTKNNRIKIETIKFVENDICFFYSSFLLFFFCFVLLLYSWYLYNIFN